MRLRYTGAHTVTFVSGGVGEVEPGSVFEVSEDVAKGFLARQDVHEVTQEQESRRPPVSKGRRPQSTDAPIGGPTSENTPTTEEVSDGVSDDH